MSFYNRERFWGGGGGFHLATKVIAFGLWKLWEEYSLQPKLYHLTQKLKQYF